MRQACHAPTGDRPFCSASKCARARKVAAILRIAARRVDKVRQAPRAGRIAGFTRAAAEGIVGDEHPRAGFLFTLTLGRLKTWRRPSRAMEGGCPRCGALGAIRGAALASACLGIGGLFAPGWLPVGTFASAAISGGEARAARVVEAGQAAE